MKRIPLDTRKTLLLAHLFNRISGELNMSEWLEEGDAILDIKHNCKAGMREWGFTEEGKLYFE